MTAAKKILQFSSADFMFSYKEHNISSSVNRPVETICIATSAKRNHHVTLPESGVCPPSVLSAENHWPLILDIALDPDLELIIINQQPSANDLMPDNIYQLPPASISGKLLSLLYWRFRHQSEAGASGFKIICRDNKGNHPQLIESLIMEMAHLNNLPPAFLDWIENANKFYQLTIAGSEHDSSC
ncbi:MAG: hypothetical protein GXC73_12695 [Chitinophagaceae bacterium]|nr:hypothetical protein [Chitinophagaceae bacterium]